MLTELSGLTRFKYGGIIIDPAWKYEFWSDKGGKRAPQRHYECMSLDEIAALPVADYSSPDCLIMLWTTGAFMEAAFQVMRAWGAEPKTVGWWRKTTKGGKPHYGTGKRLRSASEPFVIGTFGSPPVGALNLPNVLEAPEIVAPVREHSRKPDEQYSLMEAMRPGVKYAEIFGRRSDLPGWDTFGNQKTMFNEGEMT